MKSVAPYYKSVIAFVSLIGTVLVSLGANPDIAGVLPSSVTGWLASAAAVVGGTWLTWLKSNEPTVTQAEKLLRDARKLSGL
jgi:hypothetical protein